MKFRTTSLLLASLMLCIIISCEHIKSKPSLSLDFDSSDLSKGIRETLNFFEQSIGIAPSMSKTEKLDLYDEFRLEMRAYYTGEQGTRFPFSFDKQQTFYQSLDGYFFANTWGFGVVQYGPDPTKYISINLKVESDVIRYISGEKSDFIKHYTNNLKAAGDISPANSGHMAISLKKSDLESAKFRLLMALHFLTLSDQVHRRTPL